MFKSEDASYPSFCLGREVAVLQGAHGPWPLPARFWTTRWAQCFPPCLPFVSVRSTRVPDGLSVEVFSETRLMSTSRRAVPAGRMSEPGLSWGAFPLARVFPALLACTVDLRAGVLQKMGGVTGGGPWGCRGGPCVKGGPSAPREAGAAFQSAVVISHCQKVRARFTFSHALKQLCYEKFQTQAEVETTAPRSQDTCPPRSLLPRCCRGGLIWLLFLFLFLCCSISKQVPDIMAFHLSALQYVVKKKKSARFRQ